MNFLKVSLQVAVGALLFTIGPASGEETQGNINSRAELFPPSIIAYAEAADLGAAIELIRNHPVKERILAIPAYETAMRSGGLKQLQMGIAGFEATMGAPWYEALSTLSNGGVSIGLDKSGAVALLIKSSDEKALEKFRNLLLAFLPKKDGAGIARQIDYRGVTAYELKGGLLAKIDTFLLLTNQPEMGRTIVDQYLDRKPKSLATLPSFQKACQSMATKPPEGDVRLIAGYVDLDAIRAGGIAKDVFQERIDNIAAEIVLGGVLTNLRHSPFVTASVDLSDVGVELRLNSPHNREWESPREYQFGDGEIATAPRLIPMPDRLFAVSAHRDLSQMWLRNSDFLSEKAVDSMAKADAQLGVFFSGRDFGDDILGSFGSGIQVAGRVQDFKDRRPQPAIKVPEFAIVFQMKDAETTQPEMRRTFQSFIGFLNVVGAMDGNPQLDLGMETSKIADGEAQLYTAIFIAKQGEEDSMAAPIQFNFSPTLAFAGDKIVFSSSISLAKTLVAISADEDADASKSNTKLTLNGEMLKRILQENRQQLVASNMLSKGQNKQEAEAEIGLLLELVGFLGGGQVDLQFDKNEMTISAKVQVK